MSKTLSKPSSSRKATKPTKRPTTKKDEIIVTVTEAQYQAKRARGLEDDEVLQPGRHTFIRGGFIKRHPELDPRNAQRKQRITMWLDTDIVEHFKRQADAKNAPAYQTQINQALRSVGGCGVGDYAGSETSCNA